MPCHEAAVCQRSRAREGWGFAQTEAETAAGQDAAAGGLPGPEGPEGPPGEVPWAKVLELLAVNRLLDPRSELFVHEKWFPQTAMDVLLDCDFAVAHKDRLYREERRRPMSRCLKHCRHNETSKRIEWECNRDKWQAAVRRDGAHLLRAHWLIFTFRRPG